MVGKFTWGIGGGAYWQCNPRGWQVVAEQIQWWKGADGGESYWALAFLVSVVGLAALAHWLRGRWFGNSSFRRRAFDAQAVADKLARHNPAAGELVAYRNGDGDERSIDEAPVLFLHRNGELLRKGKCFYLAAAGDREALLKSLRRQRIARVQFGRRGAQRSVEVRAVGRKRLTKRARRLVDEPVDQCWLVVAVGQLQDEQDRELVRYYLQNPGGESVQICSYIRLRLFVYAIAEPLREEEVIGPVSLRPYRPDADQWQRPVDAAATVAQVHGDLRREGVEEIWVAKWSADNERRPLGFFSLLGLQQERKADRLKLRCKWLVGGDEDALEKGDDLIVGYASGCEQKELLARVVRRRGRRGDLELRTQPRAEAGLPVEVVDFSATGMRLAITAKGLDYFAGDLGEGCLVAISAYPQFAFPDKARDYVPKRQAKIELLCRVERIEDQDEPVMCYLGLRFVYEPIHYDADSGQVVRWRALRDWEAKPLLDIHRALDRLYGFLNSEISSQKT